MMTTLSCLWYNQCFVALQFNATRIKLQLNKNRIEMINRAVNKTSDVNGHHHFNFSDSLSLSSYYFCLQTKFQEKSIFIDKMLDYLKQFNTTYALHTHKKSCDYRFCCFFFVAFFIVLMKKKLISVLQHSRSFSINQLRDVAYEIITT